MLPAPQMLDQLPPPTLLNMHSFHTVNFTIILVKGQDSPFSISFLFLSFYFFIFFKKNTFHGKQGSFPKSLLCRKSDLIICFHFFGRDILAEFRLVCFSIFYGKSYLFSRLNYLALFPVKADHQILMPSEESIALLYTKPFLLCNNVCP